MEIDKLVNRHKMYFWMRIFGKNSPVGVLLILSLLSVSVQSEVLKRVLLDCDDHSVEDFLVFVLSLLTGTGLVVSCLMPYLCSVMRKEMQETRDEK